MNAARTPRLHFQEFHEFGEHGVRPDLVAFGVGVEVVGHDFGGEGAVGGEEFIANIQEEDLFVVGNFGEQGVDLFDVIAVGIGGGGAAGEDGQEEDFGLGLLLFEFADDEGVAFGNLFVGGGVDVVGAEHEDDDFGFEALEFPILHAPEDALGGVAADAEVGGFEGFEVFVPDGAADGGPVVSDGVADEEGYRCCLRRGGRGYRKSLWREPLLPRAGEGSVGGDGPAGRGDGGRGGRRGLSESEGGGEKQRNE